MAADFKKGDRVTINCYSFCGDVEGTITDVFDLPPMPALYHVAADWKPAGGWARADQITRLTVSPTPQ